MVHQPRQGLRFTALLERNAGMLLLAAAAYAKMRAARRDTGRAVGEPFFYRGMSKIAFVLSKRDFCTLAGQ